MSWICERRCSTLREVNAAEHSLRSRVCAGASMNSICLVIIWAIGSSVSRPIVLIWSGAGVRSAENLCRTVKTFS